MRESFRVARKEETAAGLRRPGAKSDQNQYTTRQNICVSSTYLQCYCIVVDASKSSVGTSTIASHCNDGGMRRTGRLDRAGQAGISNRAVPQALQPRSLDQLSYKVNSQTLKVLMGSCEFTHRDADNLLGNPQDPS